MGTNQTVEFFGVFCSKSVKCACLTILHRDALRHCVEIVESSSLRQKKVMEYNFNKLEILINNTSISTSNQ